MSKHENWKTRVRRDNTGDVNSEFYYLRYDITDTEGEETRSFSEWGEVKEVCSDFSNGTLLRTEKADNFYTIWIPVTAKKLHFDNRDRISPELWQEKGGHWSFFPNAVFRVEQSLPENSSVCITYLKIEDPDGHIFNELTSVEGVEIRRYLKSDWFDANSPSDFWEYCINGEIYDPRTDTRRVDKRFKSQQCALAWWGYFEMLWRETGKIIYSILQNEVARSIAEDFEKNGTWRHGYWFDSMEIHSRFYLDGVYLLISQHEKTGNDYWLNLAESAINYFLENLTDWFDNGNLWFLHDSMEGERKHHVKSVIFGKSPGNSLVINTHVQALCVLQKFNDADSLNRFSEPYNQGLKALFQVLEHQPAEFLYKLLNKYVLFYENRRDQAESALKFGFMSLQRYIMFKLYWKIQQKFPRIAYPSGFMERDLSFSVMSKRYHVLNVKDLLILYNGERNSQLFSYIKKGTAYLKAEFQTKPLDKHLKESSFFIEYMDVLDLYNDLVKEKPGIELQNCEDSIKKVYGGVSLDYYIKSVSEQTE